MNIINKLKVGIVLLTNLLAFLLPFILYYYTNKFQPSLSDYYFTSARTMLFMLLLIISIGFMIGRDSFVISGILLILIAFINVHHRELHNILAGAFFTYTTILIICDKRYWQCALPIVMSILFIPFHYLYEFEIIAIWSIVGYSTLHTLRYMKLTSDK